MNRNEGYMALVMSLTLGLLSTQVNAQLDGLPDAPDSASETPFAPAADNTATGADEAFVASDIIPDATEVVDNGQMNDRISVAFEDAPLAMVVNVFTKWSGANIIATPSNLTGTVTVNLEDVEWRPALKAILKMQDLALQEDTPGSQVYSIVPVSPDAPAPLIMETIFLKYANVASVQDVITPMLDRGQISPFPSRNIMVVRATESNMTEIKDVIASIDIPVKQVYIEAKILELNDEAIQNLGINWEILSGYEVRLSNLQLDYAEALSNTDTDLDESSRLRERSLEDRLERYFDFNGMATDDIVGTDLLPPPARQILDVENDESRLNRERTSNKERSIADLRTATLSASDFRVILSALNEQAGVSIVSNPKIIVANEEQARIHIGEQQPNIRGTVTPGQEGQANTTTYNLDTDRPYFQFGITLDVTPTVNTASNITLSIRPVLSRFIQNITAPDGTQFPVTSERTIETIFNMESGKTAAIGGLTETEDRKNGNSIPLLGSIPVIGKTLFGYKSTTQAQRETVIFVTVGLANPETMQENVGLPTDAGMTQKKLIQVDEKNRKNQAEIDDMRQAAEDARRLEVEKRSRLLDKRK